MMITRCLFRIFQKSSCNGVTRNPNTLNDRQSEFYKIFGDSLFRVENTESQSLFEVKHEGETGFLRYDAAFDKHGVNVAIFCDIPGVTGDTLSYSVDEEGELILLDEEVWDHAPESKEFTPDILAQLDRLLGFKIQSNCIFVPFPIDGLEVV